MSGKGEDVMDLLDSLDVKQSQKPKPKKSSTKRKENARKAAGDDILGFLDELDQRKETPSPKPKEGSETTNTATDTATEGASNQKEAGAQYSESRGETPSPEVDDNAPKEAVPRVIDPVSSITSWWSRNKGDIWSKASGTIQDAVSDAVRQARQAEALVREEQTHFSLNSLQNRLTSVLNTIVPPISHHEQLKIHIFHDMVGYPSVDNLLYEVFDYVMDQVEGGGDLNMVVQKGKERHRVGSDYDVHRTLNYARCSVEDGIKLAKANVEEIKKSKDGESNKSADPDDKDSAESKIRVSEVYVSIQPVVATQEHTGKNSEEYLYFVVYLEDIKNGIELSTASQALPYEWARWLDSDGAGFKEAAIDPREWVFGWVEDALNLSFGVVAQKYVTTRMGLTHTKTGKETPKD